MCEKQEKWNLQFFRAYVPAFVAELNLISSTFEQYVHCVSDFNSRLSTLLMQQPPRFRITLNEQLYSWVHKNILNKLTQNKIQLSGLTSMLKQFKGDIMQLSCYFKDNDNRTRQIETRKVKVEAQLLNYQKQYEELFRIKQARLYQCLCYRASPIQQITQLSKQKLSHFLQHKVQTLRIELQELKIKQQISYAQQNKTVKLSLQKLKASIQKTVKKQKQKQKNSQKFQTFNRKQASVTKSNNCAQISEFGSFHDVNKLIEQVQLQCERQAYQANHKLNQSKANLILQAAIFAQSQDERYSNVSKKLSESSSVKNLNKFPI